MSPLVALLSRLSSRAARGVVLGLERVESALGRLGEPHLAVPVVHLAGTNGKGSTSAMVERVLREAGLATGLTTSPHLIRYAERVQLRGEPIADAPFAAALERVLALPEELTFFESLTLVAFVAFAEAGVDVAVLETGLGGRLDATNVCRPVATAITSIALDHQGFLGSTLAAIASEKAGIAKAGVPLVVGRIPGEARSALMGRALELGATPILELGRELVVSPGPQVRLAPWGGRGPLELPVRSSLEGPHQLDNAAVALALARVVLDDDRLARAAGALERVEWPGRFERLARAERRLVLDGAHNPDGASALARALDAAGERRFTLLFGAMDDKPVEEMLAELVPRAGRVVLTEPALQGPAGDAARPSRRPAPVARLRAACARAQVDAEVVPERALELAVERTPVGGLVVVCGSLYLVGRVRAALLGVTPDPALGL